MVYIKEYLNIPYHRRRLRNAVSLVKKSWPYFIISLLVCLLTLTVLHTLTTYNGLNAGAVASYGANYVAVYTSVSAALRATQTLVFCSSMVFLYIWVFLAWFGWNFLTIVTEVPFQILSLTNPLLTPKNARIQKFIESKIHRKLFFPILATGVLLVFYLLRPVNLESLTAIEIADRYGIIFLYVGIAVICLESCTVYNIFKSRAGRSSSMLYENYLSDKAISRSFKSLLDILVYFAFVILLFVPLLSSGFYAIAETGASFIIDSHYSRLTFLHNFHLGEEVAAPAQLEKLFPPSRANVSGELYIFGKPIHNLPDSQWIRRVQKWIFLMIATVGLLDLGRRVIAKSIIQSGYKKLLRRVSIITVKTLLITISIQLIVQYAYFIDISDPISIGFIFSTLMTFFLVMDSERYTSGDQSASTRDSRRV